MDSLKGIPQMEDRTLGYKLATAFALYQALRMGGIEELDPITKNILEESIYSYAKSIKFKAEA